MVSRDTSVHAAVVAIAIAAVLAINWAYPSIDSPALAFVTLFFYGLVLAGAHLFLAWLGEDGIVPVASRWRFVGLVAVVLALVAGVLLTDPVDVLGVSSHAILAGLAVVGTLVYWVLEARDGYEATGA